VKRTAVRTRSFLPALLALFTTTAICARRRIIPKITRNSLPRQPPSRRSAKNSRTRRMRLLRPRRRRSRLSRRRRQEQRQRSPQSRRWNLPESIPHGGGRRHLLHQISRPDRQQSYNLVQPPENQLYVGWTEPGEWFNITVQVAHAGTYSADLLYTSNRGGTISMDVNGKDATGPLPHRFYLQRFRSDCLAAVASLERQARHFERSTSAGKSVLIVHILTEGNMNLAYFDFKPAR